MSLLSLPQLMVANADFVTPRLAIGGDLDYWDHQHARNQLAELVDVGVTHIVDARVEASDQDLVAALAPQVGYLHHGMDDAGQRVPGRWFDVGVGFVLDALRDPEAVVLTHCHMGINRGPSLGYAVLLAQGWDLVEALDAIRGARPIAAIGYAEDAAAWHHRRTAASSEQRRRDLQQLAQWRRANNIDVETIIRQVRLTEAG
jgi:hypothetical protein